MALPHDKPACQPNVQLPSDLFARSSNIHTNRKHDAASYVWLIYSVFFFIEPIVRHSAHYWRQQAPIYALFLTLYISYLQWTKRSIRLAIIVAFFVLGVCTIPYNLGGSCFFIYTAAMLPFVVESSAVLIAAIVIELVTLGIESQLFRGNPFNYAITGFFTIVVGLSNLFVAQAKRADQKLRQAQEENVELAAVAERERIARDLHDVLGHTLSVIVLKAELAGRLIDRDPTRAAAEMADVERTARTALAEVREAIGGYRSRGLNAEVEQARLTLNTAGVALACETRPPALPARTETVLSLVVREAVTNIVRHAHATQCTMRFATAPDGFASLEVADNGIQPIAHEGNGLRGMRERVQELGGRFRIETNPGTTLVIELPRTA